MIPVKLIDFTFFAQNPIYIVKNSMSTSNLNNIILSFQDEICKNILGEIEYNNFVNDFSNDEPVTQKWIDFLDGKSYTLNGKPVIWNGFKHLLKYFIYYYYNRDVHTLSSSIGQVEPQAENSLIKTAFDKSIQVYNLGLQFYGVDYNCKFIHNIQSIRMLNKRMIKYSYESNIEQYKPTAYNFLLNNTANYPDWIFTELKTINSFGI